MNRSLPPGRYVATLVRRKTFPEEEKGGIEFTFRVARGEYTGSLVSTRLWAAGRIQRADEITHRDLLEIVVGSRQTAGGKRFPSVDDFRRLSALSAADVARGVDEAARRQSSADTQPACGTFRPYPLVTDSEGQRAAEGDEQVVIDVPTIGDAIAGEVAAASRAASDPLSDGTADAPALDDCDIDDEIDIYRWGISVTGDAAPVPVILAAEEMPLPPLPVAPAGIRHPIWCSPFRYTADLPSYAAAHLRSLRGYFGPAWSCWLPIRLLAKEGLEAIADTTRDIAVTCVRLGVPHEQIVVINSWNSALTLLVPSYAADAAPQVGYERVAGHFAQVLADLACNHALSSQKRTTPDEIVLAAEPRLHVRIDRQLYGPVAIHPAINTPDASGQRFAVAISYEELLSLRVQELEELTKTPRPVPRPPWQANPVEELSGLWDYAVDAEARRSKRLAPVYGDEPRVFPDTYDWMLHGSDLNSGPKRLFRAAMNLLHLGCSREAVVLLLQPAAGLSGLTRDCVDWGIDCAVRRLVSEGICIEAACDLEEHDEFDRF